MQSQTFAIAQGLNPVSPSLLYDLHVSPAEDGRVCVSILMPPDLASPFAAILQGLSGYLSFVNVKIDHAQTAARLTVSHDSLKAAEKVRADHASRVVTLFRSTPPDLPRPARIRAVSAVLRAESHPWSSYESVAADLKGVR